MGPKNLKIGHVTLAMLLLGVMCNAYTGTYLVQSVIQFWSLHLHPFWPKI